MTRIEIVYDGSLYTVADTDPDELQTRILNAVTRPEPFWLTVNRGEGGSSPRGCSSARAST
jgi:hypothetical protein